MADVVKLLEGADNDEGEVNKSRGKKDAMKAEGSSQGEKQKEEFLKAVGIK